MQMPSLFAFVIIIVAVLLSCASTALSESNLKMRFWYNKSASGTCGNLLYELLEIRSRLAQFLDVPTYRIRPVLVGDAESSSSVPASSSSSRQVGLDTHSTMKDHIIIGSSAHKHDYQNLCSVECHCIPLLDETVWYGNAYDCAQIEVLLLSAPEQLIAAFLRVEHYDLMWENPTTKQQFPVDKGKANATVDRVLATLPPDETFWSQPVRYDPGRFYICVLGDQNVDPTRLKDEDIANRTRWVGNVTTAIAVTLGGVKSVVDFQPEKVPAFAADAFAPSPSRDAPRLIAFRILPNRTNYSSAPADDDDDDGGGGNGQPQSVPAMDASLFSGGPHNKKHRRHRRNSSSNTNKPRFFPKSRPSPNDAAASSIVLINTPPMDTLFAVGYNCYPYNESAGLNNQSSSGNFTATNSSSIAAPIYRLSVWLPAENCTNRDDVNYALQEWWGRVVAPFGLRVTPILIMRRDEYTVAQQKIDEKKNNNDNNKGKRKDKVLYLVTVAPIEARTPPNATELADLVSDEKAGESLRLVDTIGSCLFAWLDPSPPPETFAEDLGLAVMGAFSLTMLVVVASIVWWGSQEKKKPTMSKKKKTTKSASLLGGVETDSAASSLATRGAAADSDLNLNRSFLQ